MYLIHVYFEAIIRDKAATKTADAKHAGREGPVLGFAQSGFQAGEANEGLQGGTRRRAAMQIAIEQGPRQIIG